MRLTGCRPGEAFRLRWRDVDRSGDVWLYYPSEWKTEHCRTRRRVVPIATRVRQILERYAAKTPDEPIFSPRDAVRERYAAPNGDVSEAVAARIERTAERYTKDALCRAIARAAKRAGVPSWSPNHLRHAAATEIREKLGLEVARIVLGHSSTSTTEIYAEIAARRVADDVGKIWE
jgi:integrase